MTARTERWSRGAATVRFGVSWRARLRRITRTRSWQVLRFVIGLGLAALALWALNGQRGELVGASAELTHLNVGWLCLAIAFEIASLVSFGVLQRRLLQVGGVRTGLGSMAALSAASAAIADSLPGGPAFSSIYVYRFYRRWGADETLAAWALVATLVCAAAALGLVATAGVGLAASEGASYDLVWVILGVFAVSVVADAIVFQRRWLARVAVHAFGLTRRLVGRPRRTGGAVVSAWAARLEGLRLTWRDLVVSLAGALGNWVFDCACLACAFLAVGGAVPWRGLLLAYGAGQLAANLPITPGGLGVVEGSITIALVAFGGAELSTVAAVLTYRIVSFWGFLPIGWLTWAGLGVARRHGRWTAPAAASQPVGVESGLSGQWDRATVGEVKGVPGELGV
ncbi:MAG: lysylphosphatidylglycerol synthase transmembrane domain-containing protein [Acidimicrobiales bacterium]